MRHGWNSTRAILSLVALFGASVDAEASGSPPPPNVLLIMTDDMGWSDLHCQGNVKLHTPNVDALARQGVRFTDAYAAAPVCSPTRAAVITGPMGHSSGPRAVPSSRQRLTTFSSTRP